MVKYELFFYQEGGIFREVTAVEDLQGRCQFKPYQKIGVDIPKRTQSHQDRRRWPGGSEEHRLGNTKDLRGPMKSNETLL